MLRGRACWRREFVRGVVLVNPPGNGTRTVTLGAGFADLDGVVRNSQLTLAPGHGRRAAEASRS